MGDTNYGIKTPEQLVLNNVIPTWGTDLVVQHVIELPHSEELPRTYRVTFTDGSWAIYSVGATIKVLM